MRIVLVVLILVFKNFVVGSNASYCHEIPNRALTESYVSQRGEPKNISVYWDSEPTRAAASLLAAILRHVLGYQYVRLQQSPSQNHNIQEACKPNGQLKEVKLELSTIKNTTNTNDLLTPMEVELQVHLAKQFQGDEQWANVTDWNFYNGTTDLTNYGFSYSNISGNLILDVFIIELHEPNVRAMAEALTARTNASLLKLRFKEINMTDLFHTLRTQNHSFLFLGYNLWADAENIKIVESPIQKMYANITMHVTDDCLLEELAPEIKTIAENYKLSPQQLRELLELEINVNHEEAACKWILKYNEDVDTLIKIYDPSENQYYIATVFCQDNPEQETLFDSLDQLLGNHIKDKFNSYFDFKDNGYNCSDTRDYYMENLIKNISIKSPTIGVILDGVRNVKEYDVAKALDGLGVPVLVYNVADIDVEETTSVWLTSGRTLHLVLALHKFITINKWVRFIVLSDSSPTAERYIDNLTQLGGLEIINHKVEQNIKQLEVEKILKSLISYDYNTIFVNTNYLDAITILLAAESIRKNEEHNFTCIVRDWRPNERTKNISHFTISHSYSDVKDSSVIVEWSDPKEKWPAQATGYADAMLILFNGLVNVMKKYPQALHDTQSKQFIKEFERSLNDPNGTEGVSQNMTFKGHSVEETTVYLDEWHGDQRERKACWSVNTTALTATVKWGSIEILNTTPFNRTNSGCNRHLFNYAMLIAVALSCLMQNYSFIW